MLISFGYFAYLLLSLPSARSSLTITMPEDTIKAGPGSDVLLPCHIEISGPLELKRLAVIWKVGSEVIAKYEDKLTAIRQGAKMIPEELQKGNASLLLPDVQDTDSNIYSCFVIYSPDSEEGTVKLRVEAPPHVKLGSTKVQLAKPSTIVCAATDFYPGNISVTWLRNGNIVQGPELPLALPSTGHLFKAESVLKLIPQMTDANANFSCCIYHQAIEGPNVLHFQLQLQAHPVLQLFTKPPGNKFVAAECNVSKFYPSQIHIQWLQNGAPQTQVKSEVHRMHDGLFSITSILFPLKDNVDVTYVCRVEHEALEAPLERSLLWQSEVTSTTSSPPMIPWLLGLAIGLGLGCVLTAGIMHYKYKVKNTSITGTLNEKMPLQRTDEEKVNVISKSKTEKTSSESVNVVEFHDVQEQRF